MNKSIYLVLLVPFVKPVYSQEWDTNTIWIYETTEYGPPVYGNYLIHKITNDTLIQGEIFFKIDNYMRDNESGEILPGYGNFLFLKYTGRRIYQYDPYDSTVHLIYDFNLGSGESYSSYCDFDQMVFTVRIDSVSTLVQNSIERKVQYVSTESQAGCYLQGKIIEGMGSYEYLMPTYSTVDPPPGGYIICYRDAVFSYPFETDCSHIVSNEEAQRLQSTLYPNPTHGVIYIEGHGIAHVEIFNIYGQSVHAGALVNNQIDITFLEQGLYVAKVRAGKDRFSTLLIKY